MNKGIRLIKRLMALILVLIFSMKSISAVVSDNDGSAFITKAEFDSIKNNFQSQIDQYNTSIDSKIDGAIASYLAGIRTEKKSILDSIINRINHVGNNYNGMDGLPFTNGNFYNENVSQTPEVFIGGTFSFQNLFCGGNGWDRVAAHHAGGSHAMSKERNGAGRAWYTETLNGGLVLRDEFDVYPKYIFNINDAVALHDIDNYGLKHEYNNDVRNKTLNNDDEIVNETRNGWKRRSSDGNWYDQSGLSSGGGYLTLSKSITTKFDYAKNMTYQVPIGVVSDHPLYCVDRNTDLSTILTFIDPITETTSIDNQGIFFPWGLFWSHINSSGADSAGANCLFGSDQGAPAITYGSDDIYWNKQFVSLTKTRADALCMYAPSLITGSGLNYYNGLPVCKPPEGSQEGTISFSLKIVNVGSGDSDLANDIDICFRSDKFDNAISINADKNLRNVKYKKKSESTWSVVDAQGRAISLEPNIEYDIVIDSFPANKTLFVKPTKLQNSSNTSAIVHAYIKTVGDIILEIV